MATDLWLERFFSNCPPSMVQQTVRRECVVFDGYPESLDPIPLPQKEVWRRAPRTRIPTQWQMNTARRARARETREQEGRNSVPAT